MIYYLYEQTGMIGFELNGTPYYYVRNLQGDVTKILAANGSVVVQYSYDSWGKVLSVTGSLASTVGAKNPIRYRGYYYDTETELYYLNSRYYDPETGRFISPDVVAEGGNLYTYCTNDPVNRSDDSGYLSKFWKRFIHIAVCAVVITAAIAVTVATGGTALPVLAGTAIGAGTSFAGSILSQLAISGNIDWEQVLTDTATGSVLGSFGGTALSAGGMAIACGITSAANSVSNDWIEDRIGVASIGRAISSGLFGATIGYMSGGGAQYGKTAGYAAAKQTRKQIKANKNSYTTKGYKGGLSSNAKRIARQKEALNYFAISNIIQSTNNNFATTVFQNIIMG